MRPTVAVAAVLIFGSMSLAPQILAQQTKEPVAKVPPAHGVTVHHAVPPPPSANNSSAAQLAKIEQQTARTRTAKPVVHQTSAATTPALDLGKNKPIHVSSPPQAHNPASH